MKIPRKCKYCPYFDYDDQDDGETRSYIPICTRPKGEECIDDNNS